MRGFRTSADLEFVVFVCLIFGRFFAKQSPNRFTKRELGSCADGFPVWKSVSAQIVDLNAQFPERGNAAGEFFDDLWLGPAAYGFGGFCSCHATCTSGEKVYPRECDLTSNPCFSSSQQVGVGA